MSELSSSSNPETLGPRTEAPSLTDNTVIDLHRSTLGSPDQGRRFAEQARAAIDAAMRLEAPRTPSPKEIIQAAVFSMTQSGQRTVYLRQQEAQSTEGVSNEDHLRLWDAEFSEEAPIAWADKLDNLSNTDMNGYELTGSRR